MKRNSRTKQFLIGIGADPEKLEDFEKPKIIKRPQKTCENPNCKKKYTPVSKAQKYCTDPCRNKHYFQKSKKESPELIEVLKHKCVVCGKNATGFLNCKPYCKEHFTIKKKEIRICENPNCKKRYNPKSHSQKYCDLGCGKEHRASKKKEQKENEN